MRGSTANTRDARAANAAGGQTARARQRRGKRGGGGERSRLRRLARWLPLVGKLACVCLVVALLFVGYRAVAAASFFRAERVDVTGTQRTSAEHLASLVRARAASRNVWQLDLDALSAELEREPWVRQAIVSRVLPSGLRVRITERVPAVVVRTGEGRLMWADEDGVLLARIAPTDDLPPFFLRGFDETLTASAQAENRRRIRAAIEMTDEWRRAGIAERVSEVNVDDLRDVRAQLAGKDADVEVRLSGDDYADRLSKALEKLDERRDALAEYKAQTGRKLIRIGTDTLPRNVVFGFDRGTPLNSEQINHPDPTVNDRSAAPLARTQRDAREDVTAAARPTVRKREQAQTASAVAASGERRLARDTTRRAADARREPAARVEANATASAQRPRRVG